MTSPINSASSAADNVAYSNSSASQTYFPEPGENINDIANKLGIPAADIEASNPDAIPNLLKTGIALNIPAAKTNDINGENESNLTQSIASTVPDQKKPQTQTNQPVPGTSVPGPNTEEEKEPSKIDKFFGRRTLYNEFSNSTEKVESNSKACVGRMTVTTTAKPTPINRTSDLTDTTVSLPIRQQSVTTISPQVFEDGKFRLDPTAQVAAKTTFKQETKPLTEIKSFGQNVNGARTLNVGPDTKQYKSIGTLQATETRDISPAGALDYVLGVNLTVTNAKGKPSTVSLNEIDNLNSVKILQTSTSEVSGYCKFSTGEVIKADFNDSYASHKQEVKTIQTGDAPKAAVSPAMPKK